MIITTTQTELKQKIDLVKRNIEKININISENTSPIFVELIGTPKSGKTTFLKSVKNAFEQTGVTIFTRRETAEYNPVPKDSKQYDLWMVLELFKNLSEDISNGNGKIVLYDRGIFDRLTWLECDRRRNQITENDYKRMQELYKLDLMQDYRPITYCFLTSPELSVKRKGKPGKFVNVETLTEYNNELMDECDMIKNMSSEFNIVKTDEYEGRIEEFILDLSLDMTNRISRQLEERKMEKEKSIERE